MTVELPLEPRGSGWKKVVDIASEGKVQFSDSEFEVYLVKLEKMLSEFNARLLFHPEDNGCRPFRALEFDSYEDLLFFKLKFD